MKAPFNEKWSTGNLIRPLSPPSEPIEVDCSGWESDIPAEKWSTGKLVRICESLPLVSGEVILPKEARLEITLLDLYRELNEYTLEENSRHLTRDEFKRLVAQSAKVEV